MEQAIMMKMDSGLWMMEASMILGATIFILMVKMSLEAIIMTKAIIYQESNMKVSTMLAIMEFQRKILM
jgi:hypothetical protein